MKEAKLVMLLAGCLAAGAATAQGDAPAEEGKDGYLFVLPSYLSLDDDRGTSDDGRGIYVGYGQRWRGRWHWEAQVFGNVLARSAGAADFYQYGAGLDLQYRFRDGASPYFVVGAGLVRNDVEPDDDDDNDFFGNAGLGFVSNAIGRTGLRFRGEARYIRDRFETADKSGMNDWRISLGVEVPLGRVVEREVVRERVVTQTVPAEIVDSDGDGVPDQTDQCAGTLAGLATDSRGCAAETDQTVRLEGVQFEFDSTVLTPEASQILERVAESLRGEPTLRAEIAGHTDSAGPDDYNLRLSQDRADAVLEYLVGLGVDRSRLVARGYGETDPVSDNSTAEGRERNRRVEFRVIR